MKNIIAGTAGHIDHGKTEIVKALTGVDPDRLKEEKERGITIDIGFAHLAYQEDLLMGFVDVPGHERFVKNMLAGVAGIDMILLVIAADESIKPQTIEHFDICRLLNVKSGLVALTKIDLVEEDIIKLVTMEIKDFLKDSFMADSPVVPVSAKTGEGVEDIKKHLYQIALTLQEKETKGLFRMPIDRSFSIKGFGTVVTGTLVSGQVSVGDDLEIHPSGRRCKVRSIEVHSQQRQSALAGQRTALNLANVSYHHVKRGNTLLEPETMQPTKMIDARLSLLRSSSPLKDLMKVRFHCGTSEIIARAKILEEKKLIPGQSSFVQFRMEEPAAAFPQDHFIIRSLSPVITIGGGVILDNHPRKHRRSEEGLSETLILLERGTEAERLKIFLDSYETKGASLEDLVQRTGMPEENIEKVLDGLLNKDMVVSISGEKNIYLLKETFKDLKAKIEKELKSFHRDNPLSVGIAKEELKRKTLKRMRQSLFDTLLREMDSQAKIKIEGAMIKQAQHVVKLSEEEQRIKNHLADTFREAGLNPPDINTLISHGTFQRDFAEKIFQLLLKQGDLVRIKKDLTIHREHLDNLKEKLSQYAQKKSIINIADFKILTGLTRKNAIPLLEYLDQIKITKREGNERRILVGKSH
jgi:selenocysteine-specific elongation factor